VTARLGGLSLLVGGLVLALQVGCHHRPSAPAESLPANDEVPNNEGLWERHFPGVEVMRMPGGGVMIRLLGGVVGGRQPLVVVDGAPVTMDPRRGLEWLTLEMIATIQVRRDPAETAIYGPRGVNGVILVMTKQDR
jgi:TonB-dependent SusC/RagA subfamily outer membrane receptor